MPVNFQSETHATVLMLDETAETLIEMMGLTFSPPGALRSEDIGEALQNLRQGVRKADTEMHPQERDDSADEDSPVRIMHRALPLIDLLEHAEKEDEIVYWSRV